MGSQKADRASNKALQSLKKEYVVIGRRRIHSVYAWLIIGVAAGITLGIILVANQSGRFEESSASATPQFPPTTTLAAETSNNTSAYSNFPNWSDGNAAPGNVSKVDIHTLLYNGNTTKVFAVIEPWFCNAGSISTSPACNGHDENGVNENTTAQVTAQINDMRSRGIDGAMCDFYGVGYSSLTTFEQGTCDKFVQIASTKTDFSVTMMEDDGSWKWRCDATTNPTGWKQLGYASLESCVQSLIEKDLSYFNKNYYNQSSYYKVGGQPVVVYFVSENAPQDSALGASGWATVWSNVKSWAKSNGNPLFVFENTAGSGNPYWNFADGAYGWPQPGSVSSPADWASGNFLTSYYSGLSKAAFAVKQGTAYKGFNDTLASWGSGRVISQQCGQTWLNTMSAPSTIGNFDASHQLQGILIATWNDYEEGTEIETGINNCVSISASVSGNTLSWNITGQQNTLDHFTVYISTNGTSLAVLKNNIPASSRSLSLTSFNIDPGSYKLYVKAVGKPSILNHMSNAVSYVSGSGSGGTSGGSASCTQEKFLGGTITPTSVSKGGTYTVTCDYGFVGPGIFPYVGSGQCSFTGFSGTKATFKCTAGTTAGTFANSCGVNKENTANYCLVKNAIGSVTVK